MSTAIVDYPVYNCERSGHILVMYPHSIQETAKSIAKYCRLQCRMNSQSSPFSLGGKGWMPFKKRGYLWVTLGFFAVSLSVHWTFAWFAYLEEANQHDRPIQVSSYLNQTIRDTMENWQSEFLQLMWQVAGLSILWYVGSPQSKEEHDRLEEKIDYIIHQMNPEKAHQLLQKWEEKYPKR